MTKNEFINKIKKRIDRNRSLPVTLNNEVIEDIVEDAKGWFYDNYEDACYEFIGIIPLNLFNTEHFKTNRWIEFEPCIYSIYEFVENYDNAFTNYRLGGSGFLKEKIVNTLYYTKTYDIVSYVAYMGYDSVLSNLDDTYIDFDWEKSARRIHVNGHDPRTDIRIRGYKKVDETKLFEDNLFFKYVEGQARIAIGEILSTYEMPLPGNASIAADTYISRGETMVEKVEEDVNDLGKPLWFMNF
jgi:hypothetical protein